MFFSFLRSVIAESGKTQRVVAEETGITLAALANYLNGSRCPQFDVAEKLCQTCGYTIRFEKTSTNVDVFSKKQPDCLTKNEIEDLRALLKASQKSKRAVG